MKYWDSCSKQEIAEVKQIQSQIKKLKDKYKKGYLNGQQYRELLDKLSYKLDKVEKRYETD